MFQTKVAKEIKTKILRAIMFFESRFFCDILKCARARQAKDENIIRRTRFLCWIPKATNTHSQYAILIAFLLQQWLHDRASLLRYTYIGCIVKSHCGFIYPVHNK